MVIMIRLRYPLLHTALLLIAAFLMVGCARPFSERSLSKVNRSISFSDLKKDPEKYKGTWLMLAGVIVTSKNTKEGAFIEILQKPMDRDCRPLDTAISEGRFIVQSDRFLDSAVYYRGREISVIAEVVGRKELPLDEIIYAYPLLVIKEISLWEPSSGPRFFFGVGVSHQL
jgi:outer membrane lipoprotein